VNIEGDSEKSMPNYSLKGKVAVITGGRRGMGKAIALNFAKAGADIAVCDAVVEDGELGAVADEIQKLGRLSLAIRVDITRKDEVDDCVKKVIDKFGAIDIMMNVAGVSSGKPLLETSEEEWDRLFDINLKGTFLCSQAVSKFMIERRKGNIINISSTAGISSAMGPYNGYNIAKTGIIMLTKLLARELGKYNIRVNAIAPALTRTELSRFVWSNTEMLKKEIEGYPLGRIGEPSDIADAALFLASDASRFITGHNLAVDGGATA
jgi:NAD(P)-dependent dehydrogenase (short-subunit alcohol dehydrogenase family)